MYKLILTKLLLVALLSGCSQPSVRHEGITKTDMPDINEESAPTPTKKRQPAILYRDPVGIQYEYSIFNSPIFIAAEEPLLGTEQNISAPLSEIYRTIYPWNEGGDIFDILSQQLNKKTDEVIFRDVLVSYLFTEDSAGLSDEELLERLSNITATYVFSKHTDSLNYRLIAINADTEREFVWYHRTWNYFIQVWDNENIWAQPLCEGTEFIFNQAVFITSPSGSELVLLCGYTRMPNGTGLALAGTGFSFDEGVWAPVRWEEQYTEIYKIENMDIRSDGFMIARYPSWLMIPNDKLPYTLDLSEDGSFWAGYSQYSDYQTHEHLPIEKLLFQIRDRTDKFK
jgi:hypothetical protein